MKNKKGSFGGEDGLPLTKEGYAILSSSLWIQSFSLKAETIKWTLI
jgi:hypothetical protein